jgi:hypothetical protein
MNTLTETWYDKMVREAQMNWALQLDKVMMSLTKTNTMRKSKTSEPVNNPEPSGEKEIRMPTPAEYRQIRSDELLREAARQIKHLREINERLSIRTRAYDDFLSVFRNDPPSRNGAGATMGSDLVYSIERHLNHDSF